MVSKPKVLLVEDDETIATALRSAMENECTILISGRAQVSETAGQEPEPLVTLVDLESPSCPDPEEGLRILRERQRAGHSGKLIVYTGSPDRRVAIQAVRHGAAEILSKPLDMTLLKEIMRRALRMADLEQEARAGQTASHHEEVAGMLGTSSSIHRIFEAIRKVSTNDAPILITGESGTGKELTAKAIHERGSRKRAPFITINCGAIPESLLEAEMFGDERSVSPAVEGRTKGKVELADGGTLFLDDVGELPLLLQGKVLRLLQDRTFERSGGRQRHEVNVRVIAATKVNLQESIEKGTFREDLYHRLGVVHINVPPLRERGEDTVHIATAFLRHASAHHGKSIHGFTREALEAMQLYSWPGNVRELSERVGRAVVMAAGTHIRPADLDIPCQLAHQNQGSISLKINQQRIETDLIMKAFTLSHGNLSRAAHELGISRSTLYRRLRQYGMDRTLDARRIPGVSPRAWMADH